MPPWKCRRATSCSPPDNLTDYADWLEARGSSMEIASNDFLAARVLLQAWTEEGDACFELRAVQNERSASIFDVNEQTSEHAI